MPRRLYAVYDTVAQVVIGPLFQEAGDPSAIRLFRDACRDRNSMLGQHPADFELLCYGTVSGRHIEVLLSPEVVATGASFSTEVSGVSES